MSYNHKVFNLIRYTIAFLAIAILILTCFTFLDLYRKDKLIVWVTISLPIIFILMVLGKFWLSKLKRWHILSILFGYWGIIIFLMFNQSGFEVHRTYVIKHNQDPGIRADISEVFRYHLNRIDTGSVSDVFRSWPEQTHFIRRGIYYQEVEYNDTLDAIQGYKEISFPDAEIVINDYDDVRMYELSGLKPGDIIPTKINWHNRSLKFKVSGTFFTSRKECLFNIPLEIGDPAIHVDPQKDTDLTLKRLSFWAEKFTKEELQLVRKRMMVRHELRFKKNKNNEFNNYLHYDNEGELFLPIASLKIDYLPMSSCSNEAFLLAKILQHNQNPYLIRLMFPVLAENMKSWHFTDETVFVGFSRMLSDFPRDFKRLF